MRAEAPPARDLLIPVAAQNESMQNFHDCGYIQNLVRENFNPITGIGAGIVITGASSILGYAFSQIPSRNSTDPLSDSFSILCSGILASLALCMAGTGVLLTAVSCRRLTNDFRQARAIAPHLRD